MSDFDLKKYLDNRVSVGIDKIQAVQEAAEEKRQTLSAYAGQLQKEHQLTNTAFNKSAVGILSNEFGLDKNGVIADGIDKSVILGNSLSRAAGYVGSAGWDLLGSAANQHLPDEVKAARGRQLKGEASPADLELLSLPAGDTTKKSYPKTADYETNAERIGRMESYFNNAKDVRGFFDLSSAVDPRTANQLQSDIVANSPEGIAQIQAVKESLKKGEYLQGAQEALGVLPKLAPGVLAAGMDNPNAVANAVLDQFGNIASGVAGKGAATAMNALYGLDAYGQGIQEKIAKGKGEMPTDSEMVDSAKYAALAAGAEVVGDKVTGVYDLAKTLRKSTQEATVDAAKRSFMDSLLGSAPVKVTKASVGGFVGEGYTEGTQTYLEEAAKGNDASAKEIAIGAGMGALAGSGMSSGIASISAAAETAKTQVTKKAEEVVDTEKFIENAKTGNIDDYLDENSKAYSPATAVAALYSNNQAADATPETKQKNIDRANSIVTDLETKRDDLVEQQKTLTLAGLQEMVADLKAQKDSLSPRGAEIAQMKIDMLEEDITNFDASRIDPKLGKSLETKIAGLDRQIAESAKIKEQLGVDFKAKEEDIDAAIEKADTVSAVPEENVASAEHVVSLAMANPDSFSDESINRLVSNTANGLTAEQRTYLRNVSEARIKENALKSMGKVGNEILLGDPAKNQLGIADYKQRIGAALTANNQTKADTSLHMLSKFADGHKQKADLLLGLFNKVETDGPKLVIPTKRGWELSSNQSMSPENIKANRDLGGLLISNRSSKLVGKVLAESAALNASHAQMQAAYVVKFTKPSATTQSTTVDLKQPPVVSSTNSTQSTPNQSTKVDSTVDQTTQATVTNEVDQATGNKEQATAPTNPSDTTASVAQDSGEGVQSTEVVQKPKRVKSPSDKRDDLIGAILRVTGGQGLDRNVLMDIIRDVPRQGRNGVRELYKKDSLGVKDLDDIAKDLRDDEGYDVQDGKHLAELVVQHSSGNPVYSIERTYAEADKAKENAFKTYKRTVSQEAKDLGLKGIRGRRTLEHVLNDIAKEEARRNELEAAEERAAIQLESIISEELAKGRSLEDILAENADIAPVTVEEVTYVESDSINEEIATVATEREAQEGADNRSETGSTEEGEGTNGEAGKLSIFSEVKEKIEGKFADAFRKINLVVHNLIQKGGKDNKTQRPLVAVKDFLKTWTAGKLSMEDIQKFVGDKPLSDIQQNYLEHFRTTANNWLPSITGNLVLGKVDAGAKLKKAIKDKAPRAEIESLKAALNTPSAEQINEYRYTDPIQYLLHTAENGKADMEENIKTAIALAAYMHVAENAKAPQVHDEAGVKSIFGLSEYDVIHPTLVAAVAELGSPEKTVINSMGQRVTQALGLKANNQATQDFLARLESSLGAHVMKLLVDQKVLERKVVSAAVIKRGLNSKDQGAMFFVRMKRSDAPKRKDRKLTTLAQVISDNAVGTQGVLTNLFGTEAQVNEPSFEPITTKQRTTANTDQEVPDFLSKIVQHENSVANYVRQDVFGLMQELGDAAFLAMAGFVDLDNESVRATMHHTSILSAEAKNDALKRELETAKDYFTALSNTDKGLEQPLYLHHSVWKQQRVGIDNVINPQSSKIHRWMLTRSDWKTEVASDGPLMDSFFLRVAEGLGVKTDKQDNEKSLAAAKELFNTSSEDKKTREKALILQGAVDALSTVLSGAGTMTDTHRSVITAGVVAGGEKMHSMDALIAMAEYQMAQTKAGGKPFKFTVQLMGEVDGVTNGPMLSHLLMGAAKNSKALFDRLNKGGFFQTDSNFSNYNVWRGTPGHQDLYESTTESMLDNISKMGAPSKILDALQQVTGQLRKEDGSISKDGRNIIKKPLTAMLFGSTVDGAVDSMFQEFMGKAYEGFEKIAKMKPEQQAEALAAYVASLNTLLNVVDAKPLPKHSLTEFLTTFEFSEAHEAALESVFKGTLGEAVKETMKTEFEDFIGIRTKINNTAAATFDLYDAAYKGIRQNVIAELVQSGEIAVGDKKNELHDLTVEQEKLIDDRIADLVPVVHTYMSKQSKNAAASGLHISKSSRGFSTDPVYQTQVRFGSELPSTEAGKPGALSLRAAAYQRFLDNPGVAMVPMMIHSLDSAISHMAAMGRQVLNVHDAHGSGLAGFIETAKALNKATWDAVMGYSPAAEMRDSFYNTLLGMDALLQSGENTEAVIAELQTKMEAMGKKYGTWYKGTKTPMAMRNVLQHVANEMAYTAHRSDQVKYSALSQLQHLDQYALEGGQYDVTEKDRAEALERYKALGVSAKVPGSIQAAIDRVNLVVLGAKAGTSETHAYGDLGKSSIQHDKELARSFEDKNTQTAEEVIKQIEGKLSKPQRVMLQSIRKLISPNLKIQMITTNTKDGVTLSKEANARGWFAYKGKAEAIYVLSPEFKSSGLTPDLILHELIHAALARAINKPTTPEAKQLMASLNSIRDAAEAFINGNPELKTKYPFKLDVHELVSWGMSDAGFQKDVLEVVPMQTAKVSNKLMSLMVGFIKAISKYFKTETKTVEGVSVTNAMAALIQDVSGLILEAQNAKNNEGESDTHSSAMEAIHNLSTLGVYEALDEGKVSPTFDAHLRGLLEGIVTKLHGPFGTFKSLVEQNQVKTAKGVWNQAKRDGIAPFASASLASGIPMSDQVAFVLEQVEATIQGALNSNTSDAHDIVVEMNKLYLEAQKQLSGPNSPIPQDVYDFLFKMEGMPGEKADHLARFAALGLAHPEINAALQFSTSRAPATTEKTFAGRLENFFHKVLEWFNGKVTHTFAGQNADEKLTTLVNQLGNIEAKRKEPMLQRSSALAFLENSLTSAESNLRGKVERFGRSGLFTNRKSQMIRATGAILSTIAGDRKDALMETIQKLRDRQITQGHGLLMGTINEIRGMNDGNKMFHRLIREAKMREVAREDLIVHTGNVALESFINQGKDLTQADKDAITAGLLRTDLAALLEHFELPEIYSMLQDRKQLNSTIASLESQLDVYKKAKGFYKRQAKILAYKMATGNVKGKHLLMNASNIAQLVGTGRQKFVTAAEATAATPIIDQLTSLYAFKYVESKHVAALNTLLVTESARGNESGIEMVLKLHKSLQEQSKERLFSGSEALMMKGYTPEIYDPRKEVLVATEAAGEALIRQGYAKQPKSLGYDPVDPDRQIRHIYTREGGGLRPWLSTIFSYTGETAKGSRSRTDNVKNLDDWKANKQDLRKMRTDKLAAMNAEFVDDASFDPSKVEGTFAAPVLNAQGDVTDYRYLMRDENKDATDILNRNSSFDKVLGFYAGSIFDKESTKENNRKAVQALHEQYQVDFATRSESYRKVGMESEDKELREIFMMLPEGTKQAIKEIWGTDYMMVRSDLMDINFGYRKLSITNAFEKEKKGAIDTWFVGLMTHTMGEKAAYNLRRAEDIWQEIVGEAKDILVVKNLSTLLGNIGSNISLLYWQGVPLADMVRHHRVAIRGLTNYRRDSAALIDLETKLAAGYITTTKAEMVREIARLNDALDRNPVKELIDAGLMPSIVEDVAPEDDMYSYKSQLTGIVDKHTNKWNKQIIGAGRMLYMAKDTQMYKTLRHATQMSDFVARYALYKHVTSRKDSPMNKEEAVQLASDAFINYDLPSHRKMQFMNDMGLVIFTKYYMRIQKVIMRLYAENPGRALALLATDYFFSNAPILTDSGFTHKLGNNPLNPGAFMYPGTLDELGTIKAIAGVLR